MRSDQQLSAADPSPSVPGALVFDRRSVATTFSSIILVGLVVGIAQSLILGGVFDLPWPLDTFLHRPGARWTDYTAILDPVRGRDPYATGTSNYLPFGYLLAWPFTLVPNTAGFFLMIGACVGAVYWTMARCFGEGDSWTGLYLALMSVLSYPVLFAIDRGNFAVLVLVLLGGAVLFVARAKYLAAAVLMSLAIAVKAYPAIFLVLFWKRGSRRYAFLSAGLVVVETVVSLLWMRGDIGHHLSGFLSGLRFYQDDYVVSNLGLPFCTTLYCGTKWLIVSRSGAAKGAAFGVEYSNAYTVASVALVALAAFVAYKSPKYWQKVAILTIAMILFPSISADYNVAFLLISVAVLFGEKEFSFQETVYLLLVSLLLVPKNFFHLPGEGGDAGTNIGVFLNPLLLLGAMGVACSGLYDGSGAVSTSRLLRLPFRRVH